MGEYCGGCNYHEFPYKAQSPILIDGKRDFITFKCNDDVWKIVDLLIEEVHENNTKGKEFDVSQSVNAQLPFFTCRNYFMSREIQKDIERYIYCKELGIPPYKGSYGEQPAKWVDTFFIIKSAIAKKEKMAIKTNQQRNKIGSN